MTYPPKQTLAVQDGGLGLVDAGTALPLIIGACSAGTVNTLYVSGDPNSVEAVLGDGPAVELALPVIEQAGGALILKTATSTAASNGSVTKTAFSTSTGTLALTGSARFPIRGIALITGTGALGVAKFKYTLDGGYTYSEELTVPSGGTYAAPRSGISLVFTPGGGPIIFEAGDSFAFSCVAAHYTTSDLGTAITALLTQLGTHPLKQVFFAGQAASGSAAATLAAAMATHLATLASKYYYVRGILDGGNDTAANVQSAFSTFGDARTMVCFGQADIVTLDTGIAGYGVPRVAAMNAIAERYAGADLSENAGRVSSGPLRGVRAITHDEAQLLAFSETDRITTLRTFQGGPGVAKAGFYCLNGYLKSPTGSDFRYYDWGRVIDVLCDDVIAGQNPWLLAKLRALTNGSGNLDPRDAERIQTLVRQIIRRDLVDPSNIEGYKGHVSGMPSYVVDLTNDYLSTGQFRSTASAVPLRAAESAAVTVGFARSVS